MAETKENKNNSKPRRNSSNSKKLLPFDELPVAVKRNRRLLYEYIRTGELPK